jgi:bifunctional DNA-binding transcriptional regulator/antitoxin component of YhaV-PrlF toxin-antitoxin module
MRTNIPALARDVLELKPHDILLWDINEEKKTVKLKKVE